MKFIQTIVELVPRRRRSSFARSLPSPYDNEEANNLYNSLFCDDPSAFELKEGTSPSEWQRAIYLGQDAKMLALCALDVSQDALFRFHVFKLLRSKAVNVPYKLLLGVVIENHLKEGLDTLAVYADGLFRRIAANGTTFQVVKPDELEAVLATVFDEAQKLVYLILPSDQTRSKPPAVGRMRVTALTSQGVYTVEARVDNMLTNHWTSKLVKTSQHLVGPDLFKPRRTTGVQPGQSGNQAMPST